MDARVLRAIFGISSESGLFCVSALEQRRFADVSNWLADEERARGHDSDYENVIALVILVCTQRATLDVAERAHVSRIFTDARVLLTAHLDMNIPALDAHIGVTRDMLIEPYGRVLAV